MIALQNLSAGYEGKPVISDITLAIPAGKICVLLGSNGAGKSTILNSIFGLTTISSGGIEVEGRKMQNRPTPKWALQAGIALVSQKAHVFPSLKVYENIKVGCLGQDRREVRRSIEHALSFFPELERKIYATASQLSGGEQQMVAICRALAKNPTVLMLDEPLNALSPAVTNRLAASLKEISRTRKTSIIIAEHNIRVALSIADMVIGLRDGRVRFSQNSPPIDDKIDAIHELYL